MPALEKAVTNNADKRETFAIVEDDAAARTPRAPPRPASVTINVEGAFIVEEETNIKNGTANEHVHWEHKDIRLPHHTDVVSHVAVDVPYSPYPFNLRWLLTQFRSVALWPNWCTSRAKLVLCTVADG